MQVKSTIALFQCDYSILNKFTKILNLHVNSLLFVVYSQLFSNKAKQIALQGHEL